jgi:hypothetical protein
MKFFTKTLFFGFASLMAFTTKQGASDNVEYSCLKKNKASNTCHFNFIVDGAKYRFVDIGCKYEKKKDDVIQKVKAGELALAKDWKIECPAVKEDKPKTPASGF